jgi:hypothetical protein
VIALGIRKTQQKRQKGRSDGSGAIAFVTLLLAERGGFAIIELIDLHQYLIRSEKKWLHNPYMSYL